MEKYCCTRNLIEMHINETQKFKFFQHNKFGTWQILDGSFFWAGLIDSLIFLPLDNNIVNETDKLVDSLCHIVYWLIHTLISNTSKWVHDVVLWRVLLDMMYTTVCPNLLKMLLKISTEFSHTYSVNWELRNVNIRVILYMCALCL